MIHHLYPLVKTQLDWLRSSVTIFQDKINSIMLQLKPTSDSLSTINISKMDFLHNIACMNFMRSEEEEVLKPPTTSPAKSCELDPFPSKLLVRHCLNVAPIITQIINASLTQGEFTSELKTALVHPLLKKPGIDCIFRNYRPYPTYLFCPN